MKYFNLLLCVLLVTVLIGCKTIPVATQKTVQDLKVTQNEISNIASDWKQTNTSSSSLLLELRNLNVKTPSSEFKSKINDGLVRLDELFKSNNVNADKLEKQSELLNDPILTISEQAVEIQNLKEDKLGKLNTIWILIGAIGAIGMASGIACFFLYERKLAVGVLATGLCLSALSYFFISHAPIIMGIGAVIVCALIVYMAKSIPKDQKAKMQKNTESLPTDLK